MKTHTHSLHTRTKQLRVVPDEKIWGEMVRLIHAVCSNGISWNEKKFLFLEEGSQEKKKKSYASTIVVLLTDKLALQVVVLPRS